jgi:hypothetical protein
MVNIVFHDSKTSVENEINLVRKGLKAQPIDSTRWHPLPMNWFIRWKQYRNFDMNVPELCELQVRSLISVNNQCSHPLK